MPKYTTRQPYRRTRTQTLGVRAPRAVVITIAAPDGTKSTSTVMVPSRVSQTTCSDVVTPGFQQLAAKGTIVNGPFSKVSTLFSRAGDTGFLATRSDASGTHTWSCSQDLAAITWGDLSAPQLRRVNLQNLINYAQTQALAGVQAPVLEGLVSLAELRETLGFLLAPKRKLAALLKDSIQQYERDLHRYGNLVNRAMEKRTHRARAAALKRIQRNPPKRPRPLTERLEFIPDMVLAYNLGWKPLLMDVDAILHGIPDLVHEERRTSRATKSDSTSWSEVQTLSHSSGNSGTFTFNHTEDCVVRAGVIYADGFSPLQHFGIELAHLPGAVWEAIPLSFLADYVVNVGDYISSLRTTYSRSILAQFTKTTVKLTAERVWVKMGVPSPWQVVRHPTGSDFVTYEAVSRWPDAFTGSLAHTPLFDWTYRPPAQLQNVLSLLTNLLTNTRKRTTA